MQLTRLSALIGLVAAFPLAAQERTAFTAERSLDVATWSIGDLSDDGAWLVTTSLTRRAMLGVDHRRDGDPTYLRPAAADIWVVNTATGDRRKVFPEPRNRRAEAWSPDAGTLALLVEQNGEYALALWDRQTARLTWPRMPADRYVAENSDLAWSRDGSRVLFNLRTRGWKDSVTARFREMTEGPVFVQSSTDPFLAWDALRRDGFVRSVASLDRRSGRVVEILSTRRLTTWRLAEDDSTLVWQEDITPKTDYDVIFGTETRLLARRGTADSLVVVRSTKGISLVPSRNGLRYAYAKDGRLVVGTVVDTATRVLAGPGDSAAAPRDTSKAARDARQRERFTPLRWSADGSELIARNSQGLWVFDVERGGRELFLDTTDTLTAPEYSLAGWSEDGESIFLTFSSRTRWERGVARYDRAARRLTEVVRDGRRYQNVTLPRTGGRAVLAASDGNRPPDLFSGAATLADLRRLVATNPALDGVALARTELINYLDVDGQRQYGVVYYPPDYTPGRPYPTVFYVYEQFFDDTFDPIANVLAARGYITVKPSVSLETGHPGEAWLKGVTAAANHLIERGIADSSRLGVQGISYGGYATNLLVTQTHRFKAAINISGKVDIISFYTDSPRLGVRNTHAAEKSQDRIGATLWEQPQKYVEHSAVMFADRITTPLLLMTGDLDSNVPADNTREMYYALRRLGKQVVWANYMQGGHGIPMAREADFLDFHRRMLAWYDEHLRPPAEGPRAGN
ncbi:MAG: prolyl oligopeptidase family serine peptidase [Gemmatimonadales bacterium]